MHNTDHAGTPLWGGIVLDTILEMRNISKSFGGVKALSGVSFSLKQGEIHALVGENGAGKSTLIKILSGAYVKDHGEILMNGKPVNVRTPRDGQALGVRVIYQEFNLVGSLSVAENILLGHYPQDRGLILWDEMYEKARELLKRVGFNIDVRQKVSSLSVAEQQMVEICKALSQEASILIMDEPTAVLSEQELSTLFGTIRKLASGGVSVIYISHRLDEVFNIADRITVLKDGKTVGTVSASEVEKDELVRMMVGRELAEIYPNRSSGGKKEILRVENLTGAGFSGPISFTLNEGEILGFAGMVGSGRTETMRAIFGATPKTGGKVFVEGNEARIGSPQDAIDAGIGFLPEDRKRQGLVLCRPVNENITAASLSGISRAGVINTEKETAEVTKYVDKLKVKTPSIKHLVGNLSGGNQQKVGLAKWLMAHPKVLVCDEPTRGIDVGSKVEIYKLIADLAKSGIGIIVISSELPEIIGLCHRVLVMREGSVEGELKGKFSEEDVMMYATGVMAN